MLRNDGGAKACVIFFSAGSSVSYCFRVTFDIFFLLLVGGGGGGVLLMQSTINSAIILFHF